MRVLVIEDDHEVRQFILKVLDEAGHVGVPASDGEDGLHLATTESFDVIVVDRLLPGQDGLTIIRKLREENNTVPALVLSALGEVRDRVKGLESGADDYLVKPFAAVELLARLAALRRRAAGGGGEETVLRVADLELNLRAHLATRANRRIDLKPREFRLLEYLMRNKGMVLTRTMLLSDVWGYHYGANTNVIEAHISNLRKKIERGFDKQLIHTVRGVGYVFRDADTHP